MLRDSERTPEPPVAISMDRLMWVENRLAKSARSELRAGFDRFFDAWFDRLYSLSCQLAEGDEKLAQRITMDLFVRALRSVST